MPSANKDIGYVMLFFGIAILLFTLYQAYSFYTAAINGTLFPAPKPLSPQNPQLKATNSNSPTQLESALMSGIASELLSELPIQQYAGYVFAVLLLGVFASIGYKFASLGIAELKGETKREEEKKQ
jgi:uncharacterized membrane protein YiaA